MAAQNPPDPNRAPLRRLAYAVLLVFLLVRYDLWAFDLSTPILGLPWALGFHLAYTLTAIAVLAFLVRSAWPSHLDPEADVPPRGDSAKADPATDDLEASR
ncbi:MAG: hypothetical protein AAGN66_28280 [Acidobacteriota bacterium]